LQQQVTREFTEDGVACHSILGSRGGLHLWDS
jgi:hypothetical protein